MKTLKMIIAICFMIQQGIAQSSNFVLKGLVKTNKGAPIEKVKVSSMGTGDHAFTDKHGLFTLFSNTKITSVELQKEGFQTMKMSVGSRTYIEFTMKMHVVEPEEDIKEELSMEAEIAVCDQIYASPAPQMYHKRAMGNACVGMPAPTQWNTESYAPINENGFKKASDEPLSTLSIDVDRASYSNVRRFINNGQLPPKDAVRVEEMINYFNYDYDTPTGSDPVAMFTELSTAPWDADHNILHVGIKAREMDKEELPASNLVFLIDVSGSMNSPNKLGLLKSAMKMLVTELRDEDRVSIVVYAGAAGLVLESTPGHKKDEIYAAIDRLNAGGSTAGGAGIKLAYSEAQKQYVKGGNNRVILATDGDFNVGASSDGEMQRLIEEKRQSGVFLSVLGFGMGNYKDSKMEILADKGNGNYAYIDNLTEAKKTLVEEFGSTLFAVAKDVKIQIEFNPANVAEYRLIGYENRLLNKEDFNDDTKDAGEMGVGHVVTALYEIVPVGKGSSSKVDPLKYQNKPKVDRTEFSGELAHLKVRYKHPEEGSSKLIQVPIANEAVALKKASENLRWSTAIAGFGMLLSNSKHKSDLTYAAIIEHAQAATGEDKNGYRRECVQLMKSAEILSKTTASVEHRR